MVRAMSKILHHHPIKRRKKKERRKGGKEEGRRNRREEIRGRKDEKWSHGSHKESKYTKCN